MWSALMVPSIAATATKWPVAALSHPLVQLWSPGQFFSVSKQPAISERGQGAPEILPPPTPLFVKKTNQNQKKLNLATAGSTPSFHELQLCWDHHWHQDRWGWISSLHGGHILHRHNVSLYKFDRLQQPHGWLQPPRSSSEPHSDEAREHSSAGEQELWKSVRGPD